MFDCDSLKFSPVAEALTAVKPSAPLNLRKDPQLRYKEQLIILWDHPLNDGGSPLISYTLGVYDMSTLSETTYTIPSSATTYTVTGLTPGG